MRIAAAAFLLSLPAISGCTAVGGLVGEFRTYSADGSVQLRRSPEKFIPRAIAVGEHLGYKVSGTSSQENSITFDDNEGLGSLAVGITAQRTMTIQLRPGGKEIGLSLVMAGNANNATQERADIRLSEFKSALDQEFNR